MEQRLSIKKIEHSLEEMKEISKMDFLLFSDGGKMIAATTKQIDVEILNSVRLFADSLAESQVVRNWLFFRVEDNGELEYILLCSQGSGVESSYIVGQMAACQIRNLVRAAQEPVDKIHFLRQILNGEIPENRIEERVHQLHLKNGKFMIYVIRLAKDHDITVLETLKHLFVIPQSDFLVEMDSTKLVLIKNVRGIEKEQYEKYAETIVDNLQAEAMTNVWIGYADVSEGFTKLNLSYQNASLALKIGNIFYGEENVFCYSRLGIGRLVYQLPLELCEMFLKEVLGENAETTFDDETLVTINQLFDNNLNISETARQLYIHRNTLVYRLERIEKKLGLDIRSFEDAMLFKIAMMVRTHVAELRRNQRP